jgi:hypothetical protein
MRPVTAKPSARIRLLAGLALAGVLVAACGGSGSGSGKDSDKKGAAKAYTQLVRAFADRDGAAACRLLSADARQGLAGGAGSCERAVERGPRLPRTYRDAARTLGADDVMLAKGGRALVKTGTAVAAPGTPGRGGRPGRGGAGGRPGRGGEPGQQGQPGEPGEPGEPIVGTGEPGAPGAPGPNGGGGGGGGGVGSGQGGGGGGGGARGADGAPGGVGALALLRKADGDWKVAYAPFLSVTAPR